MNWTAIVPLKAQADRKTRLSAVLDMPGRAAVTDRLASHVVAILTGHGGIDAVRLLSPAPHPELPCQWEADEGQGLNSELDRVRARLVDVPVIVIHPDLPLLDADDVTALVDAAKASGAAIAPDRHDVGTNAIALVAGVPFSFRFGPDSFRVHCAALPTIAVVRRSGLALDVDSPADLEEARRSLAALGSRLRL